MEGTVTEYKRFLARAHAVQRIKPRHVGPPSETCPGQRIHLAPVRAVFTWSLNSLDLSTGPPDTCTS